MELFDLVEVKKRITRVPTESVQCSNSWGESLSEARMVTENPTLLVDRHVGAHDQQMTLLADFRPVSLSKHRKSAILVLTVSMRKSLHRQTDIGGVRDLP